MMHFTDADAWEAWLAGHCQVQDDVWLKIAKKGSAAASVTAAQALEVALCYGWIDSHRKACDKQFFLQRYSHRRPGSPWSRSHPRQSTQTTCRHALPFGAVTGTAPNVIGTRLPTPRKQLGQPPSCSVPWLSNQVTLPEIPYAQPATTTVASLIPV
jgi:hypothetical protein